MTLNVLVEVLTPLLRILGVPGSSLGPETSILTQVIRDFPYFL
jgi:hypothetical protein